MAAGKRVGSQVGLVGRSDLMRVQVEKILSEPRFVGVIYGSSGVGKTVFARHLLNVLNSDDHPDVSAVCFEIEAAQAAEESFLFLYDHIFDTVRPRGVARVRQALNQNPVAKGVKIATGFVKDLLAKHAGELTHTVDALSDIAVDSASLISQKKLHSQVEGSNYSKLIDAIEAAAKCSPRTFVLVLDGMERASEATITLIDSMSRRLPKNIRLQLIINSEDPAFISSDFVALKSRLQHLCANGIIELPGLTADDIVEWKRLSTGIQISTKLAEEVCAASNGRPILLKPWIDSEDEDLMRIESEWGRFYGYYDEHFNTLSSEAKAVGRLLAVAHPHAIELGWLQSAVELTHGEVAAAIDALDRNGFCEEGPKGFRCKHALIAMFLTSKMGQSLNKEYKQRLFNVLSKVFGRFGQAFAPSRLDALTADVVTVSAGADGLRFLLTFAQQVLKLGAYKQAQAKLDAIDHLFSSGLPATDEERAEVELLRAEVLSQLGEYHQTLGIVEATSFLHMTESMFAKLHFAKGEAYFRLNEYSNAVQQFKQVRIKASECGDVSLWAQTIIRLAGVTMDVGKWAVARRIGSVLMDKVLPRVSAAGDLSMQCHILRTVARIHAPTDPRKAEVHIDQSLQMAGKIGSDRVLGNCLFALGEVFRHAGRSNEARDSYEKALKIAQDTGNKDLAVYSLLGTLVLALLDADSHSFEALVERLSDAIDYDAPAEQANVNLFLAIRDYLNGVEMLPDAWDSLKLEFMRLRRHWQIHLVEYIKEAHNPTLDQVSAEIRDLQIVF